MSPRMSQGCTWVLLLAMMLAMAVGMMAWGPVGLPALPRHAARWQQLLDAWTCLPMAFAGAWGAWPGASSVS